jgi:hypothetical protein
MGIDLRDRVVLITGSEYGRIGTGFVIYRDERQNSTYLLTCNHVVDDVGGPDVLKINDRHAASRVVFDDAAQGFDLAVLRVKRLLDIQPLNLDVSGEKGQNFTTAGFYSVSTKYLAQRLKGILDEQVRMQSNRFGRGAAWYVKIENGDYSLQRGYSGAPVVDEKSHRVLGVMSLRQGKGERGLAISIEVLPKIWLEMPPELLPAGKLREGPVFIPTEPWMNLEAEIAAFQRIAISQDTQTRLILVNGEGGMGKTYLLGLYKDVADATELDVLEFIWGNRSPLNSALSRWLATSESNISRVMMNMCRRRPQRPRIHMKNKGFGKATSAESSSWILRITQMHLYERSSSINTKKQIGPLKTG